jgi:hypothetical protein
LFAGGALRLHSAAPISSQRDIERGLSWPMSALEHE